MDSSLVCNNTKQNTHIAHRKTFKNCYLSVNTQCNQRNTTSRTWAVTSLPSVNHFNIQSKTMKFANTLQERIYSSTPNPKKSQLILNLKPIENSPINSRERERGKKTTPSCI